MMLSIAFHLLLAQYWVKSPCYQRLSCYKSAFEIGRDVLWIVWKNMIFV